MGVIRDSVDELRARARQRRGELFRATFPLNENTRILDLGCGDGENIAGVIKGTPVRPANVYAADIGHDLERVAEKYGFIAVPIPEGGRLPFRDEFFDVVFCSSVIEHVTLSKADVWKVWSGHAFRQKASQRQMLFADEVRRLGKGYFVQTPNKWFPIESHTWLPFTNFLPRPMLIPVLSFTNRVWVKKTTPDWRLLTARQMARLFPDAEILFERWLGLRKSILAVRRWREGSSSKAADAGSREHHADL